MPPKSSFISLRNHIYIFGTPLASLEGRENRKLTLLGEREMKTRATVSKFLKNLGILGAISIMAVSCGGDNTSGKSGNSNTGNIGTFGNYPGYGNVYGNMSLDQMMPIIGQENPCAMGGQRSYVQIPLQGINVNVGMSHVGVSPFGDIAVVHNIGQPVMDLHICPRAGLTGQGQLLYNPIIETSQWCPVGQITAADVMLSGQVPYQVKFAPIHIPGTDQLSQLCNGMY